jgi:hypothetical protein
VKQESKHPKAACPEPRLQYQELLRQQHPLVEFQEYKYNMILNEIYSREPEAYQDLSQDNSQPQLNNLRKTRLTLRQLNKLRQMQDVRTWEFKEKLKKVKKQYAPAPVAPAI